MAPGITFDDTYEPETDLSSFKHNDVVSWPCLMEGSMVWDGTTFPDSTAYTLQLNEADIAEISHALKYFSGKTFLLI